MRSAVSSEPSYVAAYREADRLAACLLLDAEWLTPAEALALDVRHRAALQAARQGEYAELCELTASLEHCLQTDGPELRATGETDTLDRLHAQACALSDRLGELYRLGRADGWL